jgi:hypothetical protein
VAGVHRHEIRDRNASRNPYNGNSDHDFDQRESPLIRIKTPDRSQLTQHGSS